MKQYRLLSYANKLLTINYQQFLLYSERKVTGGVRYGSQTPMFKARSSDDQNYDGRKEC